MRFNLRALRLIFVPPVNLLLILIFGSLLASASILYYTQVTYLENDLFRFENQFVELRIPKNWYGSPLEYNDPSSGRNAFSAYLANPEGAIYIGLQIYDETTTRIILERYNLSDARSIINYEVNATYYAILESYSNATLFFIENGTRMVSSYEADYSTFKIINGFMENNVPKNISYMIFSFFNDGRLIKIAYWGKEEDFVSSYHVLEMFISNLRLKI